MPLILREQRLGKPPKKNTPPARAIKEHEDDHNLEVEIDRQVGDLVPQKARGEVVKRLTSIIVGEMFSGPIAHPRHLKQYEEVLPGSADRIIQMAEDRNQHHIAMDQKMSDAEIADRKLGMIIGGAIFLLLIVAALAIALTKENPTLAGIFLGAAVIGGVGLFVKGRNG